MGTKSLRSGSYGDRISFGGIVIDTLHARIHEGVAFTASALSASLADEDNLDMLLVTPPHGEGGVHLRVSAGLTGDGELRIYEGTSVSANGTELDVTNRNRRSSNVSGVSAFQDPTVDTLGTLIVGPSLLPGGRNFRATAASASTLGEHILKASTNYLIRLTSEAGQARRAGVEVLFYEASDR